MEAFNQYITGLLLQTTKNMALIERQDKIMNEFTSKLNDQSTMFKAQNLILNKLLDKIKQILAQLNTENTNVNDSIIDIMRKLDEK